MIIPAALGGLGLFVSAISATASVGFYLGTFFSAAVWFVTWWLCGNRAAMRGDFRREVPRGLIIGLGLIALFIVGALIVRFIPLLAAPVDELLGNMRTDTVAITLLTLVVNGIGEELFFRDVARRQFGKVMSPKAVLIATVLLYIAVTAAMGIPLLLVASVLIGGLAGMEAARSGNVISAITLHLTWSVGMAFLLPLIIN